MQANLCASRYQSCMPASTKQFLHIPFEHFSSTDGTFLERRHGLGFLALQLILIEEEEHYGRVMCISSDRTSSVAYLAQALTSSISRSG